jgi:ATP-dependent Lhr-like helicase
VRHGDTGAGARRRIAGSPPDILLSTPESLEAMLVSTLVTPRELFADLRAVVVDEVHAFAGDDRGWHLLAVLERLTRLAGRPLQRIGLSATVGNPAGVLEWLQGGSRGSRPATVVLPPAAAAAPRADAELDHVGSLPNAATVIAALHRGQKRLVFADSRRVVEILARDLRARGVDTYVSHSSLALDERRRAEDAFAAGRDCVIVATSTLELGVDVGDLDRVIQIGAPGTVASLLQRLGRSGRRDDTRPNMLLLSVDDSQLLQAAGVLLLWGEGFVEPVVPPPLPRQLLAQQLLALCLQEGRVGEAVWPEWLGGLPLAGPGEATRITQWLVQTGHLDHDSTMLFIGPEAERRYGRRHFRQLLSVFSAAPQVRVLHGHEEVGTVDPAVLVGKVPGPRIIALAGRSWLVRQVDWTRRQAWVEATEQAGAARWSGIPQPLSATLCDAMRRVLLGTDPSGVRLTRRATAQLAKVRDALAHTVNADGTVLVRDQAGPVRWWTWAGARATTQLAAALSRVAPGLVAGGDRFDNRALRLADGATSGGLRSALRAITDRADGTLEAMMPEVDEDALRQLKFAELLPPDLAQQTLAARIADTTATARVIEQPIAVVNHTATTEV